MLDNEIIESSVFPYNALLLLVKNKIDVSKNEKFRIIVDFNALNEVTIIEMHQIPRVNEILDKLGLSELFTTVDLSSGFYQNPISELSWKKTLFSMANGH